MGLGFSIQVGKTLSQALQNQKKWQDLKNRFALASVFSGQSTGLHENRLWVRSPSPVRSGQLIDVFLSPLHFLLQPPLSTLAKNQQKKYPPVRINKNRSAQEWEKDVKARVSPKCQRGGREVFISVNSLTIYRLLKQGHLPLTLSTPPGLVRQQVPSYFLEIIQVQLLCPMALL